MTLTGQWLEITAGLGAPAPVGLDGIIAPGRRRTPVPRPGFFPPPSGLPPSVTLWGWQGAGFSCIGIRVIRTLPDPRPIALRLAAAAVARNVVPIILTPLPHCGFERFGFRCERVLASYYEFYEAELMQYWNMAIVIDAEDVALLG
jgi:hypothetical protein